MMVDVIRTHMTAQEFATLSETNTFRELIDGEVIVSPAPKYPHQQSVGNIYFVLRQSVSGGVVVLAPLDVYLDDLYVFQPDVFWISGPDSLCKLGDDGYWHGASDLVVEVLSPATGLRDRGIKFEVYERNGVREYWLVDADARFIEVYRREDDQFTRVGVFGNNQGFTSIIREKALSVDSLLQSERS